MLDKEIQAEIIQKIENSSRVIEKMTRTWKTLNRTRI